MLSVYICVGSVCHINGSYDIIKTFEKLVKEYKLSDKVELKASFCLGNCKHGVSVKVGEDFIENINKTNAEEKFIESVLGRVKNGRNSG